MIMLRESGASVVRRQNKEFMMKKKMVVAGVNVATVCVFSLMTGCFTSNPDGVAGAAAGIPHGTFRHVHKGKTPAALPPSDEQITEFMNPGFDLHDNGLDGGISTQTLDAGVVPPVDPVPEYESYVVQPGDILGRIAVKFDTTIATLVQLNNLDKPDVLYVGQELKVPTGGNSPVSTTGSSSSHNSSSVKKGGTYVIQPGDTLSEIAVAAGVSIDNLRSLNNISGDNIWAGKELYIPEGGRVPSTTTSSSTPTPHRNTTRTTVPESHYAEEVLAPVPDEEAGANIIDVTVYPEQTLDEIAEDYGVSKAVLMSLNGITDESQVQPRMKLRVPVSQ